MELFQAQHIDDMPIILAMLHAVSITTIKAGVQLSPTFSTDAGSVRRRVRKAGR